MSLAVFAISFLDLRLGFPDLKNTPTRVPERANRWVKINVFHQRQENRPHQSTERGASE
jgi:hypothetical protein